MTGLAPVVDLTRREAALDLTGGAGPDDEGAPDSPLPSPARERLRRLWFVPAGVALLGAAALVPSIGGGGPGPGEARVLVDGTAVVTEADGGRTTVRDERVDVGPGDRIEITDGRAVFEMAGEVRLEGLAGGAGGGLDGTTVEMAVAPRLVGGQLLVDAPAPLEVRAGEAVVTVAPRGATEGAARLDRRIGLGVGSYRGAVGIESAGRRGEVDRYRRAEIAAPGALGPDDLPLRYEADDPWDRRYLGDALEIDTQIAPLLSSLDADAAEAFLDPAALRDAMPGLPGGRELADRLEATADGGEALVLAAIARSVDGRPFSAAWDRADRFHAKGAPWGLAALDQGARPADVLSAVRDALDTVDLQAPSGDDEGAATATEGADGGVTGAPAEGTPAPGPTADPAAPATPGDASTPPADGGPSDPGGTVDPPAPGAPDPTVPGGPSLPPGTTVPPALPPPPNVPGVIGGVGGGVGGVVDGATGGVDGVVPGAGGAVDGVVGGAGGVVGGLGGAVGGAGAGPGGAVGGIVGGLGDGLTGLGGGLAGG